MARNFGTQTRDSSRAASILMNEARAAGACSYATVAATLQRFGRFQDFAREQGITRLDLVTRELVQAYTQELKSSGLAASTAQNHLSAVNSVLSKGHDRQGTQWQAVKAREEGMASRDNVRTNPTPSREAYEAAQASMSERTAALAGLARELGLRSKEASLLNAAKALQQAERQGVVSVSRGTKGGRERTIPVASEQQLDALRTAAAAQGNERSLTPASQSWASFRDGELRAGRETLQEHNMTGFHDLRAAYACERYEQLTGHPAPINTADGQRSAPKAIDQAAREAIGKELGHGRTDVLVSYVGSSR